MFDKGRFEVVIIAGFKFGRAVFQPGWRWSTSVKPIVKTSSCEVHHIGYVISGVLEGVLDNGAPFRLEAGDAFEVPKGHDAWVVGDEPVVYLDFLGAEDYAKKTHGLC